MALGGTVVGHVCMSAVVSGESNHMFSRIVRRLLGLSDDATCNNNRSYVTIVTTPELRWIRSMHGEA